MTALERCEVLKDLFKWLENSTDECIYMEERIYAVRVMGMITLVKADSYKEAVSKAKRTVQVNMYGDNGTQIGYVKNLNI